MHKKQWPQNSRMAENNIATEFHRRAQNFLGNILILRFSVFSVADFKL